MVAALALDIPDGVLTLGCIGLWMAVVSATLLRRKRLSRSAAASGFLAAAFFLTGMVGYMTLSQALIVTSFVGGVLVLAPLWHIAVGMRLATSAPE